MSLTPTPRFHRLRIAEVRREAGDTISVTFDIPPHLRGAYAFCAGQYLTLRATLDGEEARRSYSICSGEGDGELRIAIKRTEGGYFSVWAQDNLRLGTEIDVMTPTGRFGAAVVPGQARLHVAIAAGSGITPVLSLLRTILAAEPASRFVLFYGSRSTQEILFRGVLEDLKDTNLHRLAVLHILSREQQDMAVLNGHLDQAKIAQLLGGNLGGNLGGATIDHAYVCGPLGMIDGAAAALRDYGVAPEKIHIERFTSTLEGRARVAPPVKIDAPAYAQAAIIINGLRREIPVAEGEAVLDAALRAGLDLPFACKGGMCCTCRARLIEGSAEMAQNFSLEPWEMAAGFVLTCQARPTSTRVVLDYDQQ